MLRLKRTNLVRVFQREANIIQPVQNAPVLSVVVVFIGLLVIFLISST